MMMADGYWHQAASKPPPEGVVVDTIGPGGLRQPLKRVGRLWFFPDGSMYVYYEPVFWRERTGGGEGRGGGVNATGECPHGRQPAGCQECLYQGLASSRSASDRLRVELHRRADLYEKDGEPGPLGYNCWGWRDIARHLREAAKALTPPGSVPAPARGDARREGGSAS